MECKCKVLMIVVVIASGNRTYIHNQSCFAYLIVQINADIPI